MRPYLKKTHHKKGLWEWAHDGGPEFKPQYCQKEKYVIVILMYFFFFWRKKPLKPLCQPILMYFIRTDSSAFLNLQNIGSLCIYIINKYPEEI
jgi:hypothetical protein